MEKRKSHLTGRCGGFTLVELIMALSVTSIILAAAATLAFAVSSAEEATGEMGQRQAHLRFASMRLRELARNSCLAFTYSTTGVIFWKDDLNADGAINGNEVAWLYVDNVGSEYAINLMEFPDYTASLTRNQLKFGSGLTTMMMATDEKTTVLLADCLSASIWLVMDNFIIVDFSLKEGNRTKVYQMCGGVRASAEYLERSGFVNLVTSDDDL
ncbi:MAG: prepilin-type N-terminal cleavage/methylation domain-containing protein [Planctomycetes bacterium]|nr:prepilin-type N-terminal cleavage/methylation domain-containing protein [Planctomycetota bacterium]